MYCPRGLLFRSQAQANAQPQAEQVNLELVVEQKGIYSVEKFLIARRLMYWQVYLHKAVLSAEQMLIQAMLRAKMLVQRGVALKMPDSLHFFISRDWTAEDFANNRKAMLGHFALLDDHDIAFAIKYWMNSSDRLLSYLCTALVNRHLFRLQFSLEPFTKDHLSMLQTKIRDWWGDASEEELVHLLIRGAESNSAYSKSKDEIKILYKDGRVEPLSMNSEYHIQAKLIKKYFLCYPKEALR